MKKHRQGTKPKEVLFRGNSTLIIRKSGRLSIGRGNVHTHMGFLIE